MASMCRWFGLVESGEKYIKTWHTRLLIHIFLLQQLGILTNSMKTRFGLSLSASNDLQQGDMAKGATAKDIESVRQLRVKCRNSLELVTVVLLDPMMYQSFTIILCVLRPLRSYHSEQSKRLRSTGEALQWYTVQSMGRGFEVLRQLAEMCSDDGMLFVAGIGKDHTDGEPRPSSCADDPAVMREDKLADTFAGLVVSLISRRLQVFCWYTYGLPGSLPKLLDPDEGPRFLAHLKTLYEDYLAMKALTYPFWKKLSARSPFNLIFVQQIVEIAKSSNWTITDGLLDVVRKAWSTMGASKIIEDAWQRERFQEERDSVNRRVKMEKVWMNPVIKKVLPEVHRFAEIPYGDQPIGKGLKDLNIQALFHPKVKDATVDVRSIEGRSGTAGWYSPSPINYFGHVSDLALFRHCSAAGTLHLGDKSWLAILLGCPNLIVKRRAGGRAYLAFASYSGIAGWGWPLVAQECGRRVIYRLDDNATPEDTALFHVTDLQDWQATTFDWAGKLRMDIEFGWKSAPLCIVPRYGFEALLQAVARQCFFSLPKTPLLQLGRHLKLEVDAGMNEVQILERLIMHSLPKVKPNDLVEILRMRTATIESAQEFLNVLENDELAKTVDEKDLQKLRDDYEVADAAMKSYTKQFVDFKQKVCPGNNKTRKQTQCKDNSCGVAYPKRLPPLADENQWSSQHRLSSWLPPDDSRLYKDGANRRWQLFWVRSRKTRSFSFQAYAVVGGAQRALTLAGGMAKIGRATAALRHRVVGDSRRH